MRSIKRNGPDAGNIWSILRKLNAGCGSFSVCNFDYSIKTENITINPASVTRGVGNDSRS